MKLSKFTAAMLAAGVFLTGCSSTLTQEEQLALNEKIVKAQAGEEVKLSNKERKFLQKERKAEPAISPQQNAALSSVDETMQKLSKESAIFVSDDIKKGLKDNYVSPDAPPLYLNPTFAKITIFPYVTKDGIYHSYEEVWVKVNDGRFVLNQRDFKKKKMK